MGIQAQESHTRLSDTSWEARVHFFPMFATTVPFAFAPGQCPSSLRPFPAIDILQYCTKLTAPSLPTKQYLRARTTPFSCFSQHEKKKNPHKKRTHLEPLLVLFSRPLSWLHEQEQGQRPLAADPHGSCQGGKKHHPEKSLLTLNHGVDCRCTC
ncbi:hypothetical protein LZ31DRAFT_159039 [Colletotrichum somersetense]|nr:hypothetical protein LZ31DRAFT_159039 [Colletotrichum somersetense]